MGRPGPRLSLALLAALGLEVLLGGASRAGPAARAAPAWVGVWTYDLCHEDRKPSHTKDTYCREGIDRIQIARTPGGVYDITLCPADPWGERDVEVDGSGRGLRFRTKEGLDVRLVLQDDRSHYRGVFRSADGHAGRVWGRRIAGCG